MIKGFIIDTTYGMITSLFVEGHENTKWWHTSTKVQGVYLFKTKQEAQKVARKMRIKFRNENVDYHTQIYTVYNEE
jgi:hypothetical protein